MKEGSGSTPPGNENWVMICVNKHSIGSKSKLKGQRVEEYITFIYKISLTKCLVFWEFQGTVATPREKLIRLENRNWTRLVQKPNWTRLRGKSENMYSGICTLTFCLFDRGKTRKSVYRSTHFHFCPYISSNLASVPNSSNFDFPA